MLTGNLDSERLPTLIMLARVPVLGQVKSRLARHIGEPQALRAHLQLLQYNAFIARAAGMTFELHIAGDKSSPWFRRFTRRLAVPLRQQVSGDIGERMLFASRRNPGTDGVGNSASIIIGSDCGDLSVDYLMQAATQLQDAPVVLGAAEDGGYVLIGQQQPFDSLFCGIDWGTDSVARCTRERAAQSGLAVTELPLQWDVDGVADWRRWQRQMDDR